MKKQYIIISIIILAIVLVGFYYFFVNSLNKYGKSQFNEPFSQTELTLDDLKAGEYISVFAEKNGGELTVDRIMVCENKDQCTMKPRESNMQNHHAGNSQRPANEFNARNSNMTMLSGSLIDIINNIITLKLDSGEEQKILLSDSVEIFERQ